MTFGPEVALIVVDVQNDFADPSGSLYVNGGEKVVAYINEQIERARDAGSLVVYTQDWHPPSTPHFAKDGGPWPVHCVAESWGAALHPLLDAGEPVIRKGTEGEDGYSGFTVRDPSSGAATPTRLAAILEEANIESVVIVGLATDYCVQATALDAVAAGFACTVLADGIRAVNLKPGDGARAAASMTRAGVSID